MKIENLGPIRRANFSLNNVNVFFGKNNSGKTYLSYLFYGILKYVRREEYKFIADNSIKIMETDSQGFIIEISEVSTLEDRLISKILKDITENYISITTNVFSLPKDEFKDMELELSEQDLKRLVINNNVDNIYEAKEKSFGLRLSEQGVYSQLVQSENNKANDKVTIVFKYVREPSLRLKKEIEGEEAAEKKVTKKSAILMANKVMQGFFQGSNFFGDVYIPAERNGVNVFREEINAERSNKVSENIKKYPNYPAPISDYIIFLNTVQWIRPLFEPSDKQRNDDFLLNVLGGKYVRNKDSQLAFRQLYSITKGGVVKFKKKSYPFNVTSSSIKSLYGMDIYMEVMLNASGMAKGVLFIDEPEMNLDPFKQVELSKILYELSNRGIKLFISTHSDYIMRAMTNIALSEKIKLKGEASTISTFNFENGEIHGNDKIWEDDYLSNFDSPYETLQNEFDKLIEKYSECEKHDD
ncbi:AAA family ATPase [Liquorilactobacillus cacaonum]|uniref:Endonuclease GajA/Old nuclease/RecF-like AAA domain-containing protein n=1 Tax=Liquorilactobacillus cacaonum DSM 21116 TaxID=1423729 RepID=A0A0R2CPI3_9LACO|nr:AAA family ATPase [Liquorilactobacillus cacaonum]KRM90345.1 hypothetical protein FC80_GL001248 [Liquorilactobacillus cacaonum DSM 21116]